MRGATRPPALLFPLAALLAVYLAAPFAATLGQLGAPGRGSPVSSQLMAAALVSAGSATAATLLVMLGGIPLGYLLARSRGRLASMVGVLVQLPLALPPLASGILLLFLLGYDGPLGRLTHGGLTDSFAGIVLAEAFVSAPFLVIAARSAFAGVDPVLEDVAATLGHRPVAVFVRVSLSLAWRGIAAGLLLSWLRAFGEFGATVMVAYHPYSLPVFTYVAFESAGLPAMLPVLAPTLAIAVLAILAGQALRERDASSARPAEPIPVALPDVPRDPAQAGQGLELALAFRRPGFTLDIAWRTTARRLAILGASGSGKSATLRLIAGLDRPDTARVVVGGQDLSDWPAAARGIAYVPQGGGLLPTLPLDRQVAFSPGCDPDRARSWCDRLGLAGLGHRRPAELSLGQQQRVALARALSRPDPCLLLLDEPFSALDSALRGRLRQEIRRVQDEPGLTTLLVTHDPLDALLLADEILLLDCGRVLQSGPIERVFRRPVSEIAARLLGAENIATGVATGDGAIVLGGLRLPVAGASLPAGRVGFAIRPDAVRLSASGLPALIVRETLRCDGVRHVLLRIGPVELLGTSDHATAAIPGPCHVTLDPAAFQIWPL